MESEQKERLKEQIERPSRPTTQQIFEELFSSFGGRLKEVLSKWFNL